MLSLIVLAVFGFLMVISVMGLLSAYFCDADTRERNLELMDYSDEIDETRVLSCFITHYMAAFGNDSKKKQ
ncbi:hypothetical protein MASR2M29_16560 [Spirochaetota bacterium]